MPELSVVIVNYNSEHCLRTCLESLHSQTWQDFEVIVVDNASTDGSMDNLVHYPEVRKIYNSTNRGFAAGQNQGMQLGGGRYLMSLNFDVILTPSCVEEMIGAIGKPGRIGAVSPKLLRMRDTGQFTHEIDNTGLLMPRNRFPRHRGKGELDNGQYDQSVLVFGTMGAVAMYRREMLNDVAYLGQFFDESFFMWYEDIDLDWRSRLRNWDCLYVPSAVAYHVGDVHGHGRSQFGAETSMRNRWRTIISNECLYCLMRNAPWLLAEEFALLHHVIRQRLIGAYLRALKSLIVSMPATLKKRRSVRTRALVPCLQSYPRPLSGDTR